MQQPRSFQGRSGRVRVVFVLTTKPEPARSPLQPPQNPVDWILGSVVLASLPVWVEWK